MPRTAPDLKRTASWDSAAHPAYNFWGTGNVEEVLPGITRPLAADLSSAFMDVYAHRLVSDLGLADLVAVAELPSANIFGFFGGRWAVNIGWLGAYVATYQPDQQSDMLAQFVRGEGVTSGVAENVARAMKTRKRVERLWAKALVDAERDREARQKARLAMLRAPLGQESDSQLMARIDRQIAMTGAVFVRHAYVSIGGAEQLTPLTTLLDRALPGHPPEWGTILTSALRNVVSAEPVQAIWDLAGVARRFETVAKAIRERPTAEVEGLISRPPDGGWVTFAAALARFREEYGYRRSQRETDPTVADWGEDAGFVISAVRTNLAMPAGKSPAKQGERSAKAREALEKRIERRLSEADRLAFRTLLDPAQAYVRGRELTKSNWVQACRAFRPIVVEMGARLAARGLIEDAEDVAFLRLAELRRAAAGELPKAEARRVVKARKAEFDALHRYELPVTFTLPVRMGEVGVEAPAGPMTLKGLAVSPGVATGRARIILDAESEDAVIEPGEILIAPFTDAPWTPLFFPAAAVVVERGGMLSHASTVAREYGIPAVVAVAHATELIPAGAMVTVDGNTGTVTVV